MTEAAANHGFGVGELMCMDTSRRRWRMGGGAWSRGVVSYHLACEVSRQNYLK